MENSNFICFLTPIPNLFSNTLRITDIEKDVLSTSLVVADGYNKIVGFNSNGSVMIVTGSKQADQRVEMAKDFIASLEKAFEKENVSNWKGE